MSSIMEKSKIPTESQSRSRMFLRSNSFQKLCSLAHPMRLKGFKSNKEALKSVFESLILTTRGAIQSVTYRILCFLFLTPFTRLLSRPLGLISGKDGKLETARLILKLTLSMIISTDKTTEEKCDNELDDTSDSISSCTATDRQDDKEEKEGKTDDARRNFVDTCVQTEIPEQENDEQFFDCRDDFTIRSANIEELRCRFLENYPNPHIRPTKSRRIMLNMVVYGCVLCCFVQLSVLAYLLNVATSIPPGLIFLISALAYIGYVMMSIFFDQCFSNRTDLSRPTATTATMAVATRSPSTMAVAVVAQKQPPPHGRLPKGIHPVLALVGKQLFSVLQNSKLVPIKGSPRMSRSATGRNRPLLCTDDKTFSKMKIL